MKAAGQRQAAIELLDLIDRDGRAAEQILRDYFRERRYAGSADRRAIGERVFQVLRRRGEIDWRLSAAGTNNSNRLRMFLLDRLEGGEPDAEAGPHGPEPPSAAERDALDRAAALPATAMPAAARGNVPAFLEPEFAQAFGGDWLNEVIALGAASAAVDLRVNALQLTTEAALSRLTADGIAAAPFGWTGTTLRLDGRPRLDQHPLLEGGGVEVQDAASQLVAALVGAQAGETVVDYCAGAGGKTLALGAAMANAGQIYACDVDRRRLERLRVRAHRAGLTALQTVELPRGGRPAAFEVAADRVLVDAPCSGSGTWRRQPEQRWRLSRERLSVLSERQRAILGQAAGLVRPGGLLVYATCSVLPAENETVVTAFLEAAPQFALLPWRTAATEAGLERLPEVPGDGRFLRLTPARHDVDGFFAAAMRRALR